MIHRDQREGHITAAATILLAKMAVLRHLGTRDAALRLNISEDSVKYYRREYTQVSYDPPSRAATGPLASPAVNGCDGAHTAPSTPATRCVVYGGSSHHVNIVTLVRETFEIPGGVRIAPLRRDIALASALPPPGSAEFQGGA